MSLAGDARYERQAKLPEVGHSGQERLSRASVCVRGKEGALACVAYLERAGVGRVAVSPREAAAPFAHAEHFRFAESRALGAGAWRALVAIKGELGVGRP